MNRIYQSIWNDKSGTFVAASENAKSGGRRSSPGASAVAGNSRFALKGLALALMLAFGSNVYAGPTGGVVSAGSASIAGSAGKTTINQSSQNAAINWQSFSIGQTEAVQFVQPNSSSVALNRVLGSDASNIMGSLSANGKVFLVNPNGILFGQGAQVNVGGLVASTLNITDSDFMAGKYNFAGAGKGTILNQGTINADGGYVALLGANVSNEGVISAKLGTVALAAGNAMTLDMAGDGLLNVTVNQGVANALAQNGGLIQADGGQVLLTTQAAGNLLQSAVNNTGVIQAQTVENHNGTIKLMGDMQSGTVNVAGKLDASAPNGGDGGFIETSAARVNVADNAIITTQSAQGKSGTWLIDPVDFTIATAGGDITPAALAIALAGNVTISSNGGSTGTLGDINVNSDVTWGAATTLTLNAVHDVNFSAGVTATTGNLVATAGNDVNVNPMAVGITVTTTGGNMTWTAGNDIWVKAGVVGGITMTGTGANNANITWTAGRDIKVDSAVTTTGANFTACCGRDIIITAKMTTTDGNVVLKAGSDGSGVGVPTVGGTVVLPTGPLAYSVTGPTSVVSLYYTPTSYSSQHDYSSNFILSGGATGPTLGAPYTGTYMLVFAKGNDKVYDGNTTATLSFAGDPTLGGVVTLVPGTATFADKNVAANIPITYSGYSLGGADAAKFALWAACVGPTTTSAAITQAPLVVTALNQAKDYGTLFTFTGLPPEFTSVGLKNGETIGSATLTSTGAPATMPVTVPQATGYPILISNALPGTFNPSNYSITYVPGTMIVNPVPLTVTAANQSKNYGTLFTFTGLPPEFTSVGLRNADAIDSATLTSTGAPATAPVTVPQATGYPIPISAATGVAFVPSNYVITYVAGKMIVNPVPLTVTANDNTKVYGQTFTPASTAFTTTALQNGETVGSVTEVSPAGTPPTAAVPGPYAIIPSSATGGTFTPTNYIINYVNGALLVTPAPLTVTANNNTKVYGQTFTPASTAFTTTALQNGETVGSVTEVSPAGTPPTAAVPGPYAIIPSSATGGTFTPTNYTINYVNGALLVTPAPLTVTANDSTKTGGTTLTFAGTEFTNTATQNGETVSSVSLVSPGTPAAAPAATYPITPSGATGSITPSNYTITYVNGVLTVTPVPLPPVQPVPVVSLTATPPGVISGGIASTTPAIQTSVGAIPGGLPGLPLAVVGTGVRMPPDQLAAAPLQPAPLIVPPEAPPAVVVPPAAPPVYVPPARPRRPDRN